MSNIKSVYRTHTCGELNSSNINEKVLLSGWVSRKRDHGGIIFLDLRDHYGITQVVISDLPTEGITLAQNLKLESVIKITGKVVKRSIELVNSKLKTGDIEIKATEINVLTLANPLPFQVAEDDGVGESQRLAYRFLDLRRSTLHDIIVKRSKIIRFLRDKMDKLGFTEFHTPILTSTSPEGARDFLVPSRIHPGKFFALPQAPQIFKQLFMVAGFDRYFQIAPCFRDEDPRADRSPGEFYQLDVEMSFVEQENVFKVAEEVFYDTFTYFSEWYTAKPPFLRLTYDEAMKSYGSDKPDLRNSLKLIDLSNVLKETKFKVFRTELDNQGVVYGLPISLTEAPSRKYLDDIVAWYSKMSGSGLGYIILEKDKEPRGSIAKFISSEEVLQMSSNSELEVIFLVAGKERKVQTYLGRLRNKLGEDFALIKLGEFKFCWITDMEFYENDEATGKLDFSHNPFSMPQGGLESLDKSDPLNIKAWQYDLVCNGYELVSGAIRNHSLDIMYRAFEIVGYAKEDVEAKFPALLNAFQFGTPPHGGFAAGIERILMLLCNRDSIRDVIPFPLSQSREDVMMGAPSEPSEAQLKELNIKVVFPKQPIS
jgi:aspartyl-tRNA synthetase